MNSPLKRKRLKMTIKEIPEEKIAFCRYGLYLFSLAYYYDEVIAAIGMLKGSIRLVAQTNKDK